MKPPSKRTSLTSVSASGRRLHGTAAILREASLHQGFDRWTQDLIADAVKDVSEKAAQATADKIYLKVLTMVPLLQINQLQQTVSEGEQESMNTTGLPSASSKPPASHAH